MLRALSLILILGIAGTLQPLEAGPIIISKRERDKLKKETVYAIDLIQRYHYKQTSFSDIDAEELLTAYLDDLDSSRVFLLQEDVDFVMDRFSGTLKGTYLYVGDLYPAFEIFNVYYERVSNRIKWIEKRLDKPFDLESEASYLTDRSEQPWPASEAEADALWEKRLAHELIMELLEDEPLDRAVEKIGKRYERMAKFLDEIEVHNVQETFITSLAQMYDPHSNFFSWDSAQEFDIQISNSLVGIGAQLRDVDGYCVIERLIPGGPAEMTGKLHPGDKIVAVAQGDGEPVDVIGMKLRKIVQQIRGESGTEVRLTVVPAHSAKRKVISLVREKVELTANLASADLYKVPDESGTVKRVGVIDLPSFYGEGTFGGSSISTSRDVEELITKLKEKNVDGIVLDLRNNGGGRLDEAVKLTGLFISEGPVVMKRTFDGEVDEDWDRNDMVAWDGPLVVLVSRSSASASEIVAGALQSHGRAIVVGDESTHGKGTVQMPVDLQSAMRRLPFSEALEVGTVKITVQQFYLPNGDSTQNRGVIADIALPSANTFLLEGEADLDNALSWDHIQPIEFTLPERDNPEFALVENDLLADLKTRSVMRQNKLEEFAYLKKHISWFEERHDEEVVSLNLEQRRQREEEIEAMRDYFEEQRDRLSRKLAYAVQPVDLDLTEEKEQAHQDKLRNTLLPNGEKRVNRFYQKVFYYQEPGDEKIHEIWVEYFDYDKAIDHAEEFAGLLGGAYGHELSTTQMTDILTRFKNMDRGSDFNALAPFEAVIGEEMDRESMLAALPVFYAKMVEVDPDVLLERAKLDVPLRESLRVVSDWVDSVSPLSPTKVAVTVAARQDEADEAVVKTPLN